MTQTVLVIGTRKGLWLAFSDAARDSRRLDGPHFTVIPHRLDSDRILVAMSTGGVCRTEDAGAGWEPLGSGLPGAVYTSVPTSSWTGETCATEPAWNNRCRAAQSSP